MQLVREPLQFVHCIHEVSAFGGMHLRSDVPLSEAPHLAPDLWGERSTKCVSVYSYCGWQAFVIARVVGGSPRSSFSLLLFWSESPPFWLLRQHLLFYNEPAFAADEFTRLSILDYMRASTLRASDLFDQLFCHFSNRNLNAKSRFCVSSSI